VGLRVQGNRTPKSKTPGLLGLGVCASWYSPPPTKQTIHLIPRFSILPIPTDTFGMIGSPGGSHTSPCDPGRQALWEGSGSGGGTRRRSAVGTAPPGRLVGSGVPGTPATSATNNAHIMFSCRTDVILTMETIT
jgi:hypothetical protein